MLSWAYGFIIHIVRSRQGQTVAEIAIMIGSLNMLIQIFYSWVFGSKNNTKLRGSYRS